MAKRTAEKDPKEVFEENEPQKKIASIFLPKEKQLSQGTWKVIPDELFIFTADSLEHRTKIAAFDLDNTLICTKSGNVFPKDEDDWKLLWPQIKPELRKHYDEGYKIVIFSNQRGIRKKKVDPARFWKKIQRIVATLAVPMQVFISLGSANYRKPYIGMWKRLESEENGGVLIDKAQSFYVGDAAGRTQTPSRSKADHSNVDRLFAINADLQFMTPEEFFLKRTEAEPYEMPKFPDTKSLQSPHIRLEPAETSLPWPTTELIVLVGSPASGKTTFAKWLVERHGYARVCQDEKGSRKACIESAKQHLNCGKSVIIDNTNRSVETRAGYITLARELSITVRCLMVECELSKAMHNNTFRQIIGADEAHAGVNDLVLKAFYSALRKPTTQEGFKDVVSVHVNVMPNIESEEMRSAYRMYLLER